MHTFHSNERLKSKKQIQELFEKGSSFYVGSIRVKYLLHSNLSSVLPQVAFIVPSKNFKKAVDRNWIKRRMREAYRIHKNKWSTNIRPAMIAFIYIGKEKESFIVIEKQLSKIFEYDWKIK